MLSKPLRLLKTLIVDDSHAILNFISAVLKQNYDVENIQTTSSPLAALGLLKAELDIDLLLLDLSMPELDGIKFLAELAELNYDGFLVVMSGVAPHIISQVEQAASNHGLNYLGTLLKPVEVEQLSTLLSALENNGEAQDIAVKPEQGLKIYQIIQAIKHQELELYYQPQVNLYDGKVYGVEVLMRLDSNYTSSLEQLLSKIEQSELLLDVAAIIVRQVFRDWSTWKKQGLELKLSMNIGTSYIEKPEFIDELIALMVHFSVPLDTFCLTVDEKAIANYNSTQLESLAAIHAKGIELALDDFGQDKSSIDKVAKLPANIVKMDRHLLTETQNKLPQFSLAENCICLAKRLGKIAILTGVDSPNDLKICDELGCDVAQGRYFSEPISAKNVLARITNWAVQTN